MKKILFYTFAAMASLVLASCAGDYDDWADPQSNAAEDATGEYAITISAGPEATYTMTAEGGDVQIISVSTSNEDVASYVVKSLIIDETEVDASVDDDVITVDAADVAKIVYEKNASRAQIATTLEVTATVSVVTEDGDAIVPSGSEGTVTITFTPCPVPDVDPEGYYVLGDFANCSWSLSSPIWMTDNGDGTYTATVTTNNSTSNWFKIYAGSYYDSSDWDTVNLGQMGAETADDASLTNLVVYQDDPVYADGVQTPIITGQSTFAITLDVVNYTYTVERAEGKYYIVGNFNGWSDSSCIENMFYGAGNNTYSYTSYWAGAWDLKIWAYDDIGDWDACFGTAVDGDDSTSGELINSGANSFEAPSAGYWTLTIDMGSQTYEWTELDTQSPTEYSYISLIGDFNSWGDDIDLEQLSGAPHNWYVEATIESDGGLKFRADHDWTTSWGVDSDAAGTSELGDAYYLTTGTGNITVAAGTYKFYFNDITGMWNIVAVE